MKAYHDRLGVLYIFSLYSFIKAMSEQGKYMNHISCHQIMPGLWVSTKNYQNN